MFRCVFIWVCAGNLKCQSCCTYHLLFESHSLTGLGLHPVPRLVDLQTSRSPPLHCWTHTTSPLLGSHHLSTTGLTPPLHCWGQRHGQHTFSGSRNLALGPNNCKANTQPTKMAPWPWTTNVFICPILVDIFEAFNVSFPREQHLFLFG